MSKQRTVWLAMMSVLVVSIRLAGAQSGAPSRFYQIVAGSYSECCGIGGDFQSSLPNATQGFVRLTADAQSEFATMTFLGRDMKTVFSVVPCPGGDLIHFSFDHGFLFSSNIIFHADPGPLPYAVYWSYTVSNTTHSLHINGTLGTAHQDCVDVPTQFRHSNVVAVLVPPPRIGISEFSKEGALLFIQGNAGWTNVVEASTDLVSWTAISTNLMPATLCPVCPYILVRDDASTNLTGRFYRCFEIR